MASGGAVRKLSNWITALTIAGLIGLSAFDLTQDEQVPVIVYGILGGIALGADADFIPSLFGRSKRD